MFRLLMMGSAGLMFIGTVALAAPVTSVAFSDGNVLNVQSVVGTGASAAYLAVEFTDGSREAFQYDFTGSANGFTMLSDVAAATSLDFQFQNYSFGNYVTQISDGSSSTSFPALYYAPPNTGDPVAAQSTTSQGITFEFSQVGISDLSISNGQILALGDSYDNAPLLPETAVPEPATLGLMGTAAMALMWRRRSRFASH